MRHRFDNAKVYVAQEEPLLSGEAREQNALAVTSIDIAQDPVLQNNLQLKKNLSNSIGQRTLVCGDGEPIASKVLAYREENKKRKQRREGLSGNSAAVLSKEASMDSRHGRNRLSHQPMQHGHPLKKLDARCSPISFAAAAGPVQDLRTPETPNHFYQQIPSASFHPISQHQPYADPPPIYNQLPSQQSFAQQVQTPVAQRPSAVGPETAKCGVYAV